METVMNGTAIFESDRRFSIHSYTWGHGMLLFRSGKTNDLKTRIDVVFTDVRAMDVRAWTDGLTIEKTDAKQLEGYRSNPAEMIEIGNIVYLVSGVGWQGFIVGGGCFFKEDELNINDPSGLLSS